MAIHSHRILIFDRLPDLIICLALFITVCLTICLTICLTLAAAFAHATSKKQPAKAEAEPSAEKAPAEPASKAAATPKATATDNEIARWLAGLPAEGGAPFTKDAAYLAGLLQVFAFLSVFVRGGFRDETEMLVAGRLDLEDMPALVKLRALGLLARPRNRPRWLARWDTLLPFFAFTSFLDGLDLRPLQDRYRDLVDRKSTRLNSSHSSVSRMPSSA